MMLDLFNRHDENSNNGLEFGVEFDNFMYDAMKLSGVT